jgi:hypothetical protein
MARGPLLSVLPNTVRVPFVVLSFLGSRAHARVSLKKSKPEPPTPERYVAAYYLQRTRFESIAERKLRRRQLTEDGNVEVSGRDFLRCEK